MDRKSFIGSLIGMIAAPFVLKAKESQIKATDKIDSHEFSWPDPEFIDKCSAKGGRIVAVCLVDKDHFFNSARRQGAIDFITTPKKRKRKITS